MKKTRITFGMLGIILALTGCGAESPEAAPFNIWPWILGLLALAVLALAGYQTYCYMQYLQKARRRRRKNTHGIDPLTIILYATGAVLILLAILSAALGAAPSDPETTTDPSDTIQTDPSDPTGIVTGWVDEDGSRYYMYADGTFATGWMDMDGLRYYFQEDGMTLSGWHEVEGILRYFRPDGSMARGEEVIDGVTYFFTASGAQVEVVSPAYPLREDYEPKVVDLSVAYAVDDVQVDERMLDALMAMLDACNHAMAAQYGEDAPVSCVTYGYQDPEELEEGEARTNEHLLGLSVDIVDTDSWSSDSNQAVQRWLAEHSWEYGFILRYPVGKSEVTGVDAQSGHYRYVGLELATELQGSSLTLEEYLNKLN